MRSNRCRTDRPDSAGGEPQLNGWPGYSGSWQQTATLNICSKCDWRRNGGLPAIDTGHPLFPFGKRDRKQVAESRLTMRSGFAQQKHFADFSQSGKENPRCPSECAMWLKLLVATTDFDGSEGISVGFSTTLWKTTHLWKTGAKQTLRHRNSTFGIAFACLYRMEQVTFQSFPRLYIAAYLAALFAFKHSA